MTQEGLTVKRKQLAVSAAILLALGSIPLWVSAKSIPWPETDKMVQQIIVDYPLFTVDYLCEDADAAVRGIVAEKGKTFILETDHGDGWVTRQAFTPVFIDVITCFKGDTAGRRVVYFERGGETEDTLYSVYGEGDPLQPGEEIFIFLNEYGIGYGSQGIFRVDENAAVSVLNSSMPSGFPVDTEKLRTTIPAEQLEKLIFDNLRRQTTKGLEPE